jgi:hypothetical protein
VTKFALAAALATALATPAFAQAIIETPTSTTVIVPPGAPGVVTRQPGSTGDAAAATYSPTGRAADSIATDSAAAGNEGQPSRVARPAAAARSDPRGTPLERTLPEGLLVRS